MEDTTAEPAVPETLWERLARSQFRAKFHLNGKDRDYLENRGLEEVTRHAADFIASRLAPARPVRDGRQTPWKGHPVFVAQHATGTCCRSCLEKWHGMEKFVALDAGQQRYVVAVIREWLEREDRDAPERVQGSLPF